VWIALQQASPVIWSTARRFSWPPIAAIKASYGEMPSCRAKEDLRYRHASG
jgi:hypothetical protein